MNNTFTDKNIAQIQQFLNGELTEKAQADFEQEMAQKEDLRDLVAHYRLLKEGFELKEIMKRRKQLKIIDALAEQPPVDQQRDNVRSLPRLHFVKKILPYAALLVLGLALGWVLFSDYRDAEMVYAGAGDEEIVLFDNTVQLVKIGVQDDKVNRDTASIALIISKVPKPEKDYIITDEFIELFFEQNDLISENLGDAKIELLMVQMNDLPTNLLLLRINQIIHQISITDEDLQKYFK